jgi:hypothetical protein
MHQDIAAYIQAARAKGMSDNTIRTVLQNMGYSQADVAAAFTQLSGGGSPASPVGAPAAAAAQTVASSVEPHLPVIPPEGGGSKKKFVWAGVIAAIVVLLGGGAAAAYFLYFAAAPTPEEALAKMLANMGQVQSFSYRLEIKTDIPYPEAPWSSSLNATGAVDRMQAFQTTATLAINTDFLQGSATFEIRALNNKLFLNLTNMSQLGFAGAFLGPFQGQWIALDLAAATSTASQFGVQVDVDASSLDPANLAEVKRAIFENFPIVITGALGVEDVEGTPSYHYTFRVDEDKLTALLTRIAAISGDTTLSESDWRDSAKTALESNAGMKGDLWISKGDLLLRKITLGGPFRVPTGSSDDEPIAGTSSGMLVLGGFNQNVPITEPTGAKPLEEVLEGLFSSFETAE